MSYLSRVRDTLPKQCARMNYGRTTLLDRRCTIPFRMALIAVWSGVPMIVALLLRHAGDAFRIWTGFAWIVGVFVTAFWGGYLSGLSVVALVYFLTPVLLAHPMDTRPGTVTRILSLAGLSLIVSWTAALRRRGEQSLADSNDELEQRVAVRTSELAATRDWLEKTLASIADAVIATNIDAKITFMNSMAESLTGWNEKEVIGRPVSEVFQIVNEETRAPVESPLDRALESGTMQALANHTVLVSRSGSEIAIDDSAAPIRDDSSRITGAVLVFRDVSTRRAAERERERMLAEAREATAAAERRRSQIHSLFTQSPVIINIHLGQQHLFELVHPAMDALLDGGPALGARARDALAEPYRGIYTGGLDRAFQSGRPAFAHEVRTALAGRETFHSFIHHPWRDLDGSIAGVMTLVIDVTDQVQARREMQTTHERLRETAKLESLGVLAGGIAHDFNNLLVGIMGNASLAQEILDPADPARELIDNLVKASDRAAQLTHQMLAYSGKGQFVIEPLDLSRSLEELLPLITPSISRSVNLELDIRPGLPSIAADRAQIQQLLMNLIINASEAYENRPGAVRVSLSLRDLRRRDMNPVASMQPLEPGSYVCLEVADSGIGMDEETRKKIFDPFFTTKFTGRGLGLSAVLGIIRAHGGAIEVDSAPGRGTTFRIWLPPSGESAAEAAGNSESKLRGEGVILLVDDEEAVRQTAAAALKTFGYTVLPASDGESAIGIFLRNRPEIALVILDLTMPILDGEAVLGRLREIDPHVKVILSSGFSACEATGRFEGRQLSGFLQKPYTARAIAAAVRGVLGSGAKIETSHANTNGTGASVQTV